MNSKRNAFICKFSGFTFAASHSIIHPAATVSTAALRAVWVRCPAQGLLTLSQEDPGTEPTHCGCQVTWSHESLPPLAEAK